MLFAFIDFRKAIHLLAPKLAVEQSVPSLLFTYPRTSRSKAVGLVGGAPGSHHWAKIHQLRLKGSPAIIAMARYPNCHVYKVAVLGSSSFTTVTEAPVYCPYSFYNEHQFRAV